MYRNIPRSCEQPALDRIEKFSLGDWLKHLSTGHAFARKKHPQLLSGKWNGTVEKLRIPRITLFGNASCVSSPVGEKNNHETVMVEVLLLFETSTSWCSTCRLRGVLVQQQSSPNVYQNNYSWDILIEILWKCIYIYISLYLLYSGNLIYINYIYYTT